MMRTLTVRLVPGEDLRDALQARLAAQDCEAGFVLAGLGSLRAARLRLAGAERPCALDGDLEVLTLCGTLGAGGPHLHASVADAAGRVWGGHVSPGCIVRTTAEVLLALLPDARFTRAPDPSTGYPELVVMPRASGPDEQGGA